MKKYIPIIALLNVLGFSLNAQLASAPDCTAAVNICASASFSVTSSGGGAVVDFTSSNNISDPLGAVAPITPPTGGGCLYSGELGPVWMIINIQTPGTLEFSFGAGPGVQTGYYDWAMWPYTGSSCSGISGNTLPPVRCSWNVTSSGGTGCAATANIPAGGNPGNFAPALNVNCGDRYIICFSNYSGVVTSVPLNFFGSAAVSCTPNSSTLAISSASICSGAVATLSVAPSPNTTYTWQPGNLTGPTISVSPVATTVYTLSATGPCGTLTGTTSVFVSPAMTLTMSSTNGNCSGALASATVAAPGSGPYTYTWSPSGGNSSVASNLSTGTYSVVVENSLGCKSTETTSVIAPAPISFTTNSSTGSYTLFCNPNSLTLNAVNTSTLANVTYTWTTPTGTLTGSSINVTQAGLYTVFGQDQTVNSCTDTQTIAIAQSTAVPGATVNPITGTLTCGGPPVTFTATSSGTTNITGVWYDGAGLPLNSPSGTPLLLSANAPGTYSVVFTNNASGCTSTQTVSVAANTVVPTMTINSIFGYTLTCSQPSLAFNISASSNIAPQIYTWQNMQTAVTVTPAAGGYTVSSPGNYQAGYKDGNGCQIYKQITVSIDTVRPAPTATTNLPAGSFTLNCYNPSLIATAVSNPLLPVSSYSWIQPSPSLVVSSQTITVNTVSVTSNPTTFTVMAQNPINGCIGKQKVLFYEDLTPPSYKIVFTPTAITCANTDVAVSVVPVGTSTAPTTYTIMSPPPTKTATTSGALFNIPGQYNATVMLTSNGCTASATPNILSTNDNPPVVLPRTAAVLPCAAVTTSISAGVIGSTGYAYAWSGPAGAAMGCTTCSVATTNMAGIYNVVITNTINGCKSYNNIAVTNESLTASFTADKDFGYAPLTVNFDNTTQTTASTSTVTTYWGYGNGVATTSLQPWTTTGSAPPGIDGQTTYNAAGIYTVNLTVSQYVPAPANKTCIGTASMVITVELPSELTVPNVFTPNGDKVNDTFFLNTTNLTQISCLIYDRWGVKMYDVNSETGNISWDGKTLGGKEVPVGTYFYIIKATGKDGETYEKKGTVSLYR